MKKLKFQVCNSQNSTHFRLRHLMQVLRQLLRKKIRSITPYFDALSYLCEYLLVLLELSQSIWFSFYPYAFYSCIVLRVHSMHASFISPLLNLLQSTNIWVNHLEQFLSVTISETKHDQATLLLEKFGSC